MNQLIKPVAFLIALFLLSACVTTAPSVSVAEDEKAAEWNSQWTDELISMKTAIRACIISHKSTNSILYGKKQRTETHLILKDPANTYLCIVDDHTQKVASIDVSSQIIPTHIPRFFPVGRSVSGCKAASKQLDQEDRFMGTICR